MTTIFTQNTRATEVARFNSPRSWNAERTASAKVYDRTVPRAGGRGHRRRHAGARQSHRVGQRHPVRTVYSGPGSDPMITALEHIFAAIWAVPAFSVRRSHRPCPVSSVVAV